MEMPARFGWIQGALPRMKARPSRAVTTSPAVMSIGPLRLPRPGGLTLAIGITLLAVAFIGGITYYSAREFTRRAADKRAANEAQSFAEHSGRLATGDAFAGYLQMLRYADDPILRSPASSPADRQAVMQQFVYLNTNKIASLALANRAGTILASTDTRIDDMRGSEAFNTTRATLGPANSDIILPEAGKSGYVEFTAPLKDDSGAVWAILYGRADPATLWKGTLDASVEGGRNVIINNEGQFSAGVPDTLLRSSWRGVPLQNGSVRADIAGVDSICGLGPVGKDTQIDHGWNVASCLPASLVQVESNRAMGDQGLVTLAAVVLAVAAAAVALRYALGPAAPTIEALPKQAALVEVADAIDAVAITAITEEALDTPDEVDAEAKSADAEPSRPAEARASGGSDSMTPAVANADVDALALIDAYERRNASLAERLRESIQARMMIATTELAEAFRLGSVDPARAAAMHARSLADLEQLRERELRSFAQELHPGLARLGLPAALRALKKDLAPEIDVALDVDPATDSVSGAGGRIRIADGLRLVVFRTLRELLTVGRDAGAMQAEIAVRREGDILGVRVHVPVRGVDDDALAAARLALEAYGAEITIVHHEDSFDLAWAVLAPQSAEPEPVAAAVEDTPDAEVLADDPALEHEADNRPDETDAPEVPRYDATPVPAPNLHVIPASLVDTTPLAERLVSVAEGIGGFELMVEVAADVDARTLAGEPVLPPPIAAELTDLAQVAATALRDAQARGATVTVQLVDGDVFFSATAQAPGGSVDASAFMALRDAIEARDGFFAISRRGDAVTISAQVPTQSGDVPAVVRIEPVPAEDGAADTEDASVLTTADLDALLSGDEPAA